MTVRATSRRSAVLLVLVLLLAACSPSDPTRQEGLDRLVAGGERLQDLEGIGDHAARLGAAFEALAQVEELGPPFFELVDLLDQLRTTPPSSTSAALRSEIDALAAQMLAEPAAAAAFDDLRAALQLLRDDVPAAEEFDSMLRGISDAGLTPSGRYAPEIGVFGDSAALSLVTNSSPYTSWRNSAKKLRLGNGYVTMGCGTLMTNSTCGTPEEWGARVADGGADVAYVYAGIWETKCWTFEDWSECHHLGEPIYDDYIRRNLDARTEALLANGARWVMYVKTNVGPGTNGVPSDLNLDRWQRWRDLLDEHAARYDRVMTIDLLPWWAANPEADVALRPDGYHFTTNSWMFWRDQMEPDLYWDRWLPRYGRARPWNQPWAPIISTLWTETTPPPAITGPGLSTTTTTTPPATTTTTTSTTTTTVLTTTSTTSSTTSTIP